MAKIKINGKELEVDPKKNLLEASISAGFDVPYFCWHPKLGSIGSCRQCAVVKYRDENDKVGRVVMSCMEPASEGSIISTEAPQAKEFRANVIEALMTNHPHDCPVCDEGGECHLQDMTVMSGHTTRRYEFEKRTHNNQYLGPFINHEMNRCIQCYRCVRYYRDYAGGDDLNVFSSRNRVYFGRATEGVLESEFSGNLVEVCPTGVFTDKTLKKHHTRKWDLTTAPSICVHCSVGCNTIAGERYGTVRRIYSRYNEQVNGYFLCDRGRFGYEFVNSNQRITKYHIPGSTEGVTKSAAFDFISKSLKGKKVVGIGSPRASLETNFALKQFVGSENFSVGLSKRDYQLSKLAVDTLINGNVNSPSLKDVEKSESVFVLGEDVTQTAPMLALAIRQAIKNLVKPKADKAGIPQWNDAPVREIIQSAHGPLHIAAPVATRLDDVATTTYFSAPENIARLGYAVAHFINNKLVLPSGLTDEVKTLAEKIAKDLLSSDKPLIVSGVHCKSAEVIKAASDVATALKSAGKSVTLSYTFEESNSVGVTMLDGKPLEELFDDAKSSKAGVLVIVENDLYRRLSNEKIDAYLSQFEQIIVLDHNETETTAKATLVLPVGTFSEADGTFVNQEGRAQRFYQVFVPETDTPESWRRIAELGHATEKPFTENSFFDFTSSVANSLPQFKGIANIAPPPDFKVLGQKVARESIRYSGRTAMKANINIHELKPVNDIDSALSFTMEGYHGEAPSALTTSYWSPGWNSAQAINKYQIEVGGALHGGDPGLRLIEPTVDKESYFQTIPEAFKISAKGLTTVPVYRIFGSEELSTKAPAIIERSGNAFIGLHPADAKKAELKNDDMVEISIGGQFVNVHVIIMNELAEGLAGVSAGYKGVNPEMSEVSFKN
jgi:NADH-quinone oxidoreductase subunit G